MERVLYPDLEHLTRADLEQLQWSKFKRRLEEWYHKNSFYREHLDRANLTPDDIRHRKDLRRIPLITKADFISDQQTAPPYGRRLGIPELDIARITMTSGTSGKGKEIHPLTKDDVTTVAKLTALAYYWAGMDRGDIIAFNVGISNNSGGWCFLSGGWELGRVPYMLGHESFPARLQLMKTFGVHGLYGTPSTLNGLTVACYQLGKKPRDLFPDLKFLLTSAEPYPIDFALRMSEEWGVRFYEDYGSTQCHSSISASCCEAGAVVDGHRGNIHMFEGSFLFEVINPETGEDVAPGEAGELIVTTLDKQASPILRFSSQDKVIWYPHDNCSCGRPFDIIQAGTISRWDDMMKIKGVNIWPAQVDEVVFSFPKVEEYQGEVYIGEKGRDEVRVRVAFMPDTTNDAERQQVLDGIARILRERIDVRFDVTQVPREELPSFVTPDLKARRWKDLRQRGLA